MCIHVHTPTEKLYCTATSAMLEIFLIQRYKTFLSIFHGTTTLAYKHITKWDNGYIYMYI